MDQATIAAKLREMATADEKRSEAARLRDLFDDIESTIKAGVPLASILETLHGQGFKMNLDTFKSALYRIRKSRKENVGQGVKIAATLKNVVSEVVEPEGVVNSNEAQSLGQVLQKSTREAKASQYIGNQNPLLKSKGNK